MQIGTLTIVASISLLVLSGTATAGNYSAVEVGTTGEQLRNSAYHQDKHYLRDDEALDQRICTVIADMDRLLGRLYALPPELHAVPQIQAASNDELAELIALALAHNPDLAPYRSELGALAARTRQSGAKQDPMLSLMVMDTAFPLIPPDENMMTGVEFELSQMFEGYGKRKLRRNIARLDERAVEQELAAREQRLIRDVASLYFDMARTKARLRVLEHNATLLDLLLELAESKYAVNDVMTPQSMVFEAQLMRTMLEEQRIQQQKLFEGQQARLTGQLGRPEGFDAAGLTLLLEYPLPVEPELDEAELLAATLDADPEYERMATMLEQNDLMLEMAEREYRPDYTISTKYRVESGMRGFVSAEVMFPLFTHKEERQDAAVQEAEAMRQNTADRQAAMENMLATMLAEMQVELGRMEELSGLYRKGLVPQARLALDSSIASYSANMLDLADLLRAQQRLLDVETELEQMYIDYMSMLVDLQIATSGAFDPLPYLIPSPETAAQSAQQVELEIQRPVPAEVLVGPGTEGFIGPLDLPAPTADDAEQPADDDDESTEEQQESATDEAEFYVPFVPHEEQE